MRQIKYNDSSQYLYLDFPPEWESPNVTGVELAINSTSGTVLETSSAAVLVTADTLSAAASSGDISVALTTGDTDSVVGHKVRLGGINDGDRVEHRIIAQISADNKTLTFTEPLDWDHQSGSNLYYEYCFYDLDTSTVATWPAGKQLVLIWTPAGIDVAPYTERAEIAKFAQFAATGFLKRFSALYPREHLAFIDTLDTLREEAQLRLTQRLKGRGLNLDRVVDQELLMPSILALTRLFAIEDGGKEWADEREVADKAYTREFEILVNDVIWADDNQDGVKDETEVDRPEADMYGRGL